MRQAGDVAVSSYVEREGIAYDYLTQWISLEEHDPQIYAAIRREQRRQHVNLELVASENYTSRAVLEATGSVLTNKYAEGYPGHRYYGGCAHVDTVETLARERAMQLFGAHHANVQPHAGTQANMAAYKALLDLGDTVLALDLAQGDTSHTGVRSTSPADGTIS